MRGLSLLLVLSFAPRGFSLATPVFPSPQKPTFPNSNSVRKARTRLNEFLRFPEWFVGKQINLVPRALLPGFGRGEKRPGDEVVNK